MIAIADALANGRKGLEDDLWEMFAYAGRYGGQPISESRSMTVADLRRFVSEISKIVVKERPDA